LTEAGARALAGLDRADSLVLDPHKWLFQPYEIGCVLVRDGALLERTFAPVGRLPAGHRRRRWSTFRDRSVQLTRGARALKLWLSVRIFGVAAFVGRGRARHRARRARRVAPPRPSRLGDRRAGPARRRLLPPRRRRTREQTRIAAAMVDDGFAVPSTTELGGRVALRCCTINPRPTCEDIERTIDRMEACGDLSTPAA